jgi:hypothetical protein
MAVGRISRLLAGIGAGLGVGLLVIAGFAFAQGGMHRNGFDTKPGWLKGGFDAVYEEIAHKIDDREPHNGAGSEYIEVDVKKGDSIHYVYPVGKAMVTEELRASLWMRANRPGMQLLARVVLPNERDPNNLDYRLTTYIKGDSFQLVGRWQLLELSRPNVRLKEQQQIMSAAANRNIDFTGAYIDALVLNVAAGPGPTRVWIDDLEVGPVQSAVSAPIVKPDNNNPANPNSVVRPPVRNNVVEFDSNRLLVGKKRMFFRAVRYTDTMLPVLRNAGFNTVFFDRDANPAIINEASELGLWVVPEISISDDKGVMLAPEDIAKQVQRHADNDAVLFRRIGGVLSFGQATQVARAAQIARTADPTHPISGDVWDGLMPYSRSLNLVGVHRWPLMTTLEMSRYREWLEHRRKLALPGAFTWTWIQTHIPEWYSEILYNQPAQAAFRDPVGPQPEQIRLLTYTALATGYRGIGFWSDRFLADSHQGRDRLLCCALLNQELEMLESLLVTVEDAPVWVDTSAIDVKAAVLRCNQGIIVLPIWQGRFSQLVPGQAAVTKLTITVPQVPITSQAWEVSPAEVRGLKTERVDKGLRITLPEFGLTSAVLFTSDTNLMAKLQDHARGKRQVAAQWSYDMAFAEYEKAVKVQAQLEQLGASVPEANGLLEDARKRLQKTKELWERQAFSEAYHEAQRAARPIRILMRAQWEKAVRGLETPVASPYAVSFYTLPKHWQFIDQVKRSTVAANQLRGGDFELSAARVQDNWKLDRPTLDDVDMLAERVSEMPGTKKGNGLETPIEGKQCLMLQIKPRAGKTPPVALENTVLSLTSPDVKLPPGTLVQVSGWIHIPAPITASPDGALLFDSTGGEPLATRLADPTPWKKITVYRRVPASGSVNVTLALTGIGTVFFDDIRIEPLVAPSGIAFDR